MTAQNDLLKRLTELVGPALAEHITDVSDDGIVYLRYPPELLRQVNDKICLEFTGANHNELANRYRVSVQQVYRTLKIHRPLPATSAHADQESPTTTLWEAPLLSFRTPGLISELHKAVQTALLLDQTGHVRIELYIPTPALQAAPQPDTPAAPESAPATHQSASQSPAAGDLPQAGLSTFQPNQESA